MQQPSHYPVPVPPGYDVGNTAIFGSGRVSKICIRYIPNTQRLPVLVLSVSLVSTRLTMLERAIAKGRLCVRPSVCHTYVW